jgi:signal transduction histidine kinase
VTHELRSPLATVTSLLGTLSEGYAGALTGPQANLVRRALGRVQGLRALVNDLLDLAASRTEVRVRQVASVDLREVVREAVDGLRGRAEARGVALVEGLPEGSFVLEADPADVRLTVDNLLDNAIKYTPKGGRVEVRVTIPGSRSQVPGLGPQPGNHSFGPGTGGGRWVEVSVSDTGIGIPPEGIARVFDDFYRSPNAKAVEAEGTGLGLSIVKGIVTRYGGRVSVESEEGKGSRFTVAWPLPAAL